MDYSNPILGADDLELKRCVKQWNAHPHFEWCWAFDSHSTASARRYIAEAKVESKYKEVLQWCWEMYGPSIDLEIWLDWRRRIDTLFSLKQQKEGEVPENLIPNKHWCWQSKRDMHPYRIYLKGQKELSMFYLKFNS